jgi:Uma2 family endonuclease
MHVSKDPTITKATLADLAAIPEEDRDHEIIDGVLHKREAAGFRHGNSQFAFGSVLGPFRRKPGGSQPGGWVFTNETEVLLAEDQIYRPDVAGWRRERMPEDLSVWPIRVIPDWVCEVLSTNKRRDTIWKMRGYHRAKVGHYWLVDPVEQSLTVQRWHADGFIVILKATAEETVRAEPFDQVSFYVGTLFGEDEPDAE